MTNKELGKYFQKAATILELAEDNPFKVKSYANAGFQLGRYPQPIKDLTSQDWVSIPGLGKSLTPKLEELLTLGKIEEIELAKSQLPEGLIDLTQVKGLGAKKILSLNRELGISSLSELEYACLENRLIALKGFGDKTQQSVAEQIQFIKGNEGKFLWYKGNDIYLQLKSSLLTEFPDEEVEAISELFWVDEIIEELNLVTSCNPDDLQIWAGGLGENQEVEITNDGLILNYDGIKVNLISLEGNFEEEKIQFQIPQGITSTKIEDWPGELRNSSKTEEWLQKGLPSNLVTYTDLVGCIHNHSNYSDGANTVEEMANACIDKGWQYLVMSDHSQSAFYANGLKADRVVKQHKEIDALNKKYSNFRVIKSIESDILNDGSLDYPDDILQSFECIIASVHSNLRMDKDKATARLIKAIEHPLTNILGHPTGRLLLGRPGYEFDLAKVIDACAANKVAMELNCNPHRLDIDWRWIDQIQNKNVMISLGPDAHQIGHLGFMETGVLFARKGGLLRDYTLNALNTNDFINWCKK